MQKGKQKKKKKRKRKELYTYTQTYMLLMHKTESCMSSLLIEKTTITNNDHLIGHRIIIMAEAIFL